MSNIVPYSDIERMGSVIAKSGLFGLKTPEQAVAMMLIAQAEGVHPAIAARDYNIIQGRPALKADAMLARFQQAGGSVKWTEMSDNRVAAVFSHAQGGSVEIDWDMKRAKTAGLGSKDMWSKYPRQMLRARVISEGIRTVFPGCVAGFYTPEEVQDFDAPSAVRNITPKDVTPPAKQIESAPAIPAEVTVVEEFGGPGIEDVRKSYTEAVKRIGADRTMSLIRSVAGDGIKKATDIPINHYAEVIETLNMAEAEAVAA